MSDIDVLRDELIAGHPVTGAYSADNATAAAEINALNITRLRSSMSGDEVFQQTDPAEYAALPDAGANNTPDHQNHWLAFVGKDSIDPRDANNIQFLRFIFGNSSVTEANLDAARQETISRGEELGLGTVKVGWVEMARS